jgi:hypothetical protein
MTIQDPISVTPNSFQLRGYDIGVSYITMSATGEPQLTYTHRGETFNFRGDQFRLDRTPFGQMIVTVGLEEEMFTLLMMSQ